MAIRTDQYTNSLTVVDTVNANASLSLIPQGTGAVSIPGTGQNLLLYSSDLTNGAWGLSNLTRTGSQTDPFGGTTAILLNDGTTNNYHYLSFGSFVTGTYTFSVYAKAGTANYIGLFATAINQGAIFNLTTGAFTGNYISAPVSYSSINIGNGWWRVSIVINASSGFGFGIAMSEDGTTATFTGTNQTVFVAAPQLEIGSTLNTYIPTTTSQVYGTPSLSFSGVSRLGLQSDGSLYASSAGSGNIRFYTNNVAQEQVRVSHTASAVNYLQLTGAAGGGKPTIAALGSDSSVGLQLQVKNSLPITFNGAGGDHFSVLPVYTTGPATSFLQASGGPSGNVPTLSALSSGTDSGMAFISKGTGAIDLAAGSSGVNISNGGTVTAVTVTASGSGYTAIPTPAVTAPTTASGVQAVVAVSAMVNFGTPTIVSGGTGYTVGDVLTVSGGTLYSSFPVKLNVTAVSSGVITAITVNQYGGYTALPTNPVSVTGGTGTGATFTVLWGVNQLSITTAGSGYVEQPTVSFSGGGGSGAAAFAAVGSATAIRSIGGDIGFYTPSSGQPGFAVRNNSGTNANYLTTLPTVSGGAVYTGVVGTDTNSGANWFTKGNGSHFFATNSGGQNQFTVAHTASAVNYVQVTGAATSSDPIISAQGSDASRGLIITSKGSSGLTFRTQNNTYTQFRIADSSAVNYIQVVGSATGSGPTFSAQGTDTNIDLNLTPKGSGTVLSNGPFTATGQTSLGGVAGSDVFRVLRDNTFAGTTVASFTAPQFSFIPPQSSFGAAVIGLGLNPRINSFGSDGQYFSTNQSAGFSGTLQAKIAHTASAVNYVQVTGAATGSSTGLAISAQGSDSNINLNLNPKGAGYVQFDSGKANYLVLRGASAGSAPIFGLVGSDTDIPLVLQPKGTGALQAQQTDSTATGGNVRGANAVDWQTSRGNAAQVAGANYSIVAGGASNRATGTYSVSSGGNNNTSSGFGSALVGGNTNTVSNSWAFLGAGQLNTVSGFPSAIVGGTSNTAAGFHNFIGAGFTNSGTSGSAVTTQSGTMNGTTAVTLSGSNASIKVGQWISGTSIADETYVAAISGTSLTLSKVASGSSTSTLSFYTPHGVVVGGGNNQATGSYSFIGGGGDAGTAGNRNVASGDWSTVGGGFVTKATALWSTAVGGGGNTASGEGSVVVGGGSYGGGLAGNTSSATSSFIGAGYGNTANGYCSAIVGGNGNVASNNFSFVGGGAGNSANTAGTAILGGYSGTVRSIQGMQAIPACVQPINTTQGTSQGGLLVLGVQTTDATATVLRSNASVAGTTNQVIMPNNSAYFFTGEVVAGVTGGGNTKGWTIEGVIKRGANAASTTLVGSTVTSSYADAGASTWTIALSADTTNGGLAVTFTGQASTTIRCVAKIETTEMTY